MNGEAELMALGKLFWLLVAAGVVAMFALPVLTWLNTKRAIRELELLRRERAEAEAGTQALLGAVRYQLAELAGRVQALESARETPEPEPAQEPEEQPRGRSAFLLEEE